MARAPDMLMATAEDFALLRGSRPRGAGRWDDVIRARAFKADEVTTDLICLELALRDGTTFLAHEEAPGWDDFLDAAEAALPGMVPRAVWYPAVTHPPFAAAEQIVFKRA